MKKLFTLAILSPLALVLFTHDDANAGEIGTLSPAQQVQPAFYLNLPTVKGNITIPASAITGDYASIQCNQIQVVATSKDMTSCTGDGFCIPQPKWTRHVNAVGSISSGSCSYTLSVPANAQFAISASSNYAPMCGWTYPQTSGTGSWMSVNYKETKTQNFKINSFLFQKCPA